MPSNCALLQRERRSLMRRAGTGSADSTTRPNDGGDAERLRTDAPGKYPFPAKLATLVPAT